MHADGGGRVRSAFVLLTCGGNVLPFFSAPPCLRGSSPDRSRRRPRRRRPLGPLDLGRRLTGRERLALGLLGTDGGIPGPLQRRVVDSQADKDTANIRANGVPGAFKVVNQLQVAGKPDGSR